MSSVYLHADAALIIVFISVIDADVAALTQLLVVCRLPTEHLSKLI